MRNASVLTCAIALLATAGAEGITAIMGEGDAAVAFIWANGMKLGVAKGIISSCLHHAWFVRNQDELSLSLREYEKIGHNLS